MQNLDYYKTCNCLSQNMNVFLYMLVFIPFAFLSVLCIVLQLDSRPFTLDSIPLVPLEECTCLRAQDRALFGVDFLNMHNELGCSTDHNLQASGVLPVVNMINFERGKIMSAIIMATAEPLSNMEVLVSAYVRLSLQLAVHYRVSGVLHKAFCTLAANYRYIISDHPNSIDWIDLQMEWYYDFSLTLWRMHHMRLAQVIIREGVHTVLDFSKSDMTNSRSFYRLLSLESEISTVPFHAASLRPWMCRCKPFRFLENISMNWPVNCPSARSRRIDHVITLFNEAFFDNSAIPTAAMGLADQWNATFLSICVETLTGSAVSEYKSHFSLPNVAIVLVAAFGRRLSVSELVQVKHPSSILLCFGGDTLYANQQGSQCEFDSCHACDVYLDLIDGVVMNMRTQKFESHPWIWTPSAALLALVENKLIVVNGSYMNAHSSVVNEMPVKIMMLFSLQSEYRARLREAIKQLQEESAGLFAVYDTQQAFLDPDSVFDLYSKSFITLSTTSTSPAWIHVNCRSVKGFRDWIAPSLGSLLVTDDHPDNIRKYGPGVFYYRYGDFDHLKQTIKDTWQRMGTHTEQRAATLRRQRDWVKNNILDIQLKFAVNRVLQANPGPHTWFDAGPCSLINQSHPSWELPQNFQAVASCITT